MSIQINKIDNLEDFLKEKRITAKRLVVAISGFGGSGKTTLAHELSQRLNNATVIHADDFITADENGAKPGYLHDWDKFENLCLKNLKELDRTISRIYDWPTNKAIADETILKDVVIVEGSAGLFRDKYLFYFDIKIWMDISQDIATTRRKNRKRQSQSDNHDDLWDNLWSPLEREGFAKERPDMKADILFKRD